MTTQETENQAGGADPSAEELKAKQEAAYANKAASESTDPNAGNEAEKTSDDTSGAAASTASTDEVKDGGSAGPNEPRGDTHAA